MTRGFLYDSRVLIIFRALRVKNLLLKILIFPGYVFRILKVFGYRVNVSYSELPFAFSVSGVVHESYML